MALIPRILGTKYPAAHDLTVVYSCPTGESNCVVGKLYIANHSTSQDIIRVAITPDLSGVLGENYIVYDLPLYVDISFDRICLGEGNALWCYSQEGTTSFVFTGLIY